MDFKDWMNFDEMPIKNWKQVPEPRPNDPKNPWSPLAKRKYGWGKVDAGILNSPTGVEKFKRLWANSEHDFNLYMVRTPLGNKHRFVGEVKDMAFIEQLIGKVADHDDDAISIIYTNNQSGDKMAFTGWTAAHRFGHALQQPNSSDISEWAEFEKDVLRGLTALMKDIYHQSVQKRKDYYGYSGLNARGFDLESGSQNALKHMAHSIGTMRTARQRNLSHVSEFALELLAQYLTTKNKVQFKEPAKQLILKYVWGKPQGPWANSNEADKSEIMYQLDNYAGDFNDSLYRVMDQCMGKFFVI
jgi:hypothetical protein